MRAVHGLLMLLYQVLPVAAAVFIVIRVRRTRSVSLLNSFLLTVFSAAAVGTSMNVIYAVGAGGRPRVGQILLASYFALGMLLLLKGLSLVLRQGCDRLLGVHPGWGLLRNTRRLYTTRVISALLLRAVLLFAIGLPYVMAMVMVYRPKIDAPPAQQPNTPHAQTVWFPANDDATLAGWWLPARPMKSAKHPDPEWGRRTIVFCHGLGSNRSNQLHVVEDFPNQGYNVLAIDFRGHGQSAGQLTSFGVAERQDVLGAVRWLRKEHPEASRHIYGLGISMGGAALVSAAADPRDGQSIDAVAVYDTYADLDGLTREIADRYFPIWPLHWMVTRLSVPIAGAHVGADLTRFSPARAAEEISPRPLLVIHGKDDITIPWDQGVRLYQAARQPKLFLWLDREDHNSAINDPEAAKQVKGFFDTAFQML